MEIKKNIKNNLMKRKEIIIEIESDKNPSFDDCRKIISEELKEPAENIDVYNIKSHFGKSTFNIIADVYDSSEDLKKAIELKKTKKQKTAEKKAEEEKKKAEEEAKKAAEANSAA